MAADFETRLRKAFGEAREVALADVDDDPRWGVAAPRADEVSGVEDEYGKAPVVLREVGGRLVAVSPAELVAARRVAAGNGSGPATVGAYVLPGVSDDDADLMRRCVLHVRHEERSDAWRDGFARLHAEFKARGSAEWARESPWRLMAALAGTYTTLFFRIANIQSKAVDEVRALVDAGRMSIRTAADVSELPEASQRMLAAEASQEGMSVADVARLTKRYRPAPVRAAAEIETDVRSLTHAVAAGSARADLDGALRLQASVSTLLSLCAQSSAKRRG